MKVLFFAQSREAAGRGEWRLDVEHPVTPAEFWARLEEAFPDLRPLRKSSRLARRESYLGPEDLLDPQDEIAVIPPVSGG